jgi:hypothetical protein
MLANSAPKSGWSTPSCFWTADNALAAGHARLRVGLLHGIGRGNIIKRNHPAHRRDGLARGLSVAQARGDGIYSNLS